MTCVSSCAREAKKGLSFLFGSMILLTLPVQAQSPSSLSEQYQDWIVECKQVAVEGGADQMRSCSMSQELLQQETGQLVLLAVISLPAEEQLADLSLVAPFGLDIHEDVSIMIGEKLIETLVFETCLPSGCLVEGSLAETTIATFKTQSVATVAIPIHSSEKIFSVNISLSGFSNAFARLQTLSGK